MREYMMSEARGNNCIYIPEFIRKSGGNVWNLVKLSVTKRTVCSVKYGLKWMVMNRW